MSHTAIIIEEGQETLDSSIESILSLANSFGDDVSLVMFNSDNVELRESLTCLNVNQIYCINPPGTYNKPLPDEVAISCLEWFCNKNNVDRVLMNKTPWALNIGPRLAFRIKGSYAQDCIDIKRQEDNELVCLRPIYGGNAIAHVSLPGDTPQVATVRTTPKETIKTINGNPISITDLKPQIKTDDIRVKILKTVTTVAEGPELSKAEIVIAGGRGLGGPEPFEKLKELAKILDGAVGASRAACDAGWIDHNFQIGLTGKTVTPNMYLTFGISGASQHMAGCSGSRNIVSINSDKNANIFKESKYGVVGDWKLVLPSFISTVRELIDEKQK